jgi:prevent-host-death family protein
VATRVIPKTELRDRIRDELAQLEDDTLLVTERGRPLAVATSVERWNQIQERIEDLEDALAVAEARLAGDAGRPVDSALAAVEAGVRGPARSAG